MEIDSRTGSLAARHHRITGGAGIGLHVAETGNENGRPVLFIHGLSQCELAWRKQLFSDLADDLRLVAMDLRGHGQSERPPDGYDDQANWAEDVHAVITTLNLERPILCGWSYGGGVGRGGGVGGLSPRRRAGGAGPPCGKILKGGEG